MINNDEYECFECGGVFTKGRLDEEAMTEAKRNFGPGFECESDENAIVCDDCYQEVKKRFPHLELE